MSFLEVFATIVGTISSFAMIPQVIKIFKRKSAKDISFSSNAFMGFAGFIWFLYGVELHSWPLIITNLLGFIIILFVIIGWFLYGRSNQSPKIDGGKEDIT